MEEGTRAGEIVSEGVTLARDLANHPGNEMTPTVLAERSMEMAEAVGLRCDVLDEEAMEREGMGALLAVARGSDQPPRLIVMEHEGRRSDQQPHVLVGKGITFDTGGISIKRAGGMWEMKFDMCGAAAVIGAMQAIARLDLPVRTIGIAAATENMPGGRALKPGDVIRSMLGKTIEIRNHGRRGAPGPRRCGCVFGTLQAGRPCRSGDADGRVRDRPGSRGIRLDGQRRRACRAGQPIRGAHG